MLKGYRLLDLSSRLPGPLCSLILADLGMEVIRVEPPEHLHKGDLFREIPERETPYFPMLNRGKKSVTLNLKSQKGIDIFYKMAEKADVVLEGFRPGVIQRLGIGWERLREINPALILASISGYGQEGAYRGKAGHDLNYIAGTGILWLNAPRGGGAPVIPPVQIGDIGGGAYPAVIGILAALIDRKRTGKGRWLDISMLDGCLFWMGLAMFDWGIGKAIAQGIPPIARGAANYNVYETRDGGYLALGALEENFWRQFCKAVGKPEWIEIYGDEEAMCDTALINELKALFLKKTRNEWMEVFKDWDTCLSPVRRLDEAAEDEYLKGRDVFRWVSLPDGKRFPVIHFPVGGVCERGALKEEGPVLGQHNEPFYKEFLGLAEGEIETLRREGVI